MPIDEAAVARKALEGAAQELYDSLMVIAKSQPDVFRRGAMALFQQQPTSAQRTQVRRQVQETGQQDPAALEKMLNGMVDDSSLQEVLDLMGSGRLPKEGV